MLRWIVSFLLLGSALGFAQAPDTLWTRTYGGNQEDAAHSILPYQGGAIVCGHKEVGETWVTYVVKFDSNGVFEWDRQYETLNFSVANSICADDNGGFVLAGLTEGASQALLIRCRNDGNILWRRPITTPYETVFHDVIQTSDKAFVAVGYGNGGNSRILAVKVDSTGTVLWQRSFGVSPTKANSVLEHMDGSLLIAAEGSITFLCLDSSGDSLWSKFEYGWNILEAATTEASNFAVCGARGVAGYFVAKLNASADTIWTRDFLQFRPMARCQGIAHTIDGGLVLAGRSVIVSGDDPVATILKVTGEGDSSWVVDVEGPDNVQADKIAQDTRGHYYVAGFANISQFNVDMWISKLDQEMLQVTSPIGSEQLPIFSTDTIRWTGVGFEGGVSIELNRHYPSGTWETITDSTENDGVYEWFVTDPLSDSCRIRICALADTFCDVSDGNFSIVSSQGYLALVKSNQPNAPLTSWDFGSVECPQTGAQWFRLKNFGSESIVVFQPQEPVSSEFARTTTCGAFFALAPNQMSACSVLVSFDPPADGEYSDVLRVQTDAVNGVNGFVEFGLNGAQISTPAAPDIVVSTSGLDAHLTWSAVDSSIGGCAVSDVWYAVFYAPTSGGPYYYHGWTADTAYTHAGVVNFSATMFYEVMTVDAPVAVAGELERGMEEGVAMGKIRALWRR